MKKLSLVFAIFLFAQSIHAQTSNGSLMFGANFLQSSTNAFSDKPTYEQNIQARIGIFAAKNFAVGANLEVSYADNKKTPYGFSVFTRLYSGRKNHQFIKFFVEVGGGIAHRIDGGDMNETVQPTKNWMKGAAYVSPGFNVFLGKVVTLEVAPEYKYIAGATAINRLGVSAGLKFFLSGDMIKQIFPHEFVRQF